MPYSPSRCTAHGRIFFLSVRGRTVFVVDRKGKIAYEDLAYSSRDSVSFNKLQSALKGIQ